MKLLAATDGSPNARMAVEEAASLAARAGYEVVLVLVSDTLDVGPPETLSTPSHPPGHVAGRTRYESPSVAEAMAILEGEAAVFRDLGVEPEVVHLRGDPAERIIETARAIGADMIVMGAQGHRGLLGLLLGSTTETVIRHAPCTVMVSRPKG